MTNQNYLNKQSETDKEKSSIDKGWGPPQTDAATIKTWDGRLPDCDQLLRAKQCHAPNGILPVSRAHFHDLVKRGILPKPIRLGPRISCWRKSDLLAFIEKMEASNEG